MMGVGLAREQIRRLFAAISALPDRSFNILIMSAYVAINAIGAVRHDMWRDEIQAWLIARDSPTIWSIVHNLRYDGHPILWYLILWPVTRITWSPDAMKLVTFSLATGAVALLLWRGPWTRLEKTLLPFGYYFIYEYGIKSRSYVVGVFLLVLLCTLWEGRRKHIVLMSLVLGALANVHLYFGLMAAALAAAIVLDRCLTTGKWLFVPTRAEFGALVIFCCLRVFAAFVAAPPARGDFSSPMPIPWIAAINGVGAIVFPASYLVELGFPISIAILPYILAEAASFALIIFMALRARTNWPVFAFFVISLGTVLGVFSFAYAPSVHHSGMLFLILVTGEWLRRRGLQEVARSQSVRADRVINGGAGWLFGAMLCCQMILGVGVAIYYQAYTHSNGRRVAEFIRASGWSGQPVAGVSTSFTTVCGYLQRPTCYYADRSHHSSYMVFDGRPGGANPDKPDFVEPSELDLYLRRASALGEAVTLVVPYSWDRHSESFANLGFVESQIFAGATVENYAVYRKESKSRQ